MKFNLNKFKKISSDEHSTTLEHPAGHSIKIAHAPLTSQMRKELHSLPMADGGKIKDPTQEHLLPGDKIPNQVEKEVVAKDKSRLKMANGGDPIETANASQLNPTEPTSSPAQEPLPAPTPQQAPEVSQDQAQMRDIYNGIVSNSMHGQAPAFNRDPTTGAKLEGKIFGADGTLPENFDAAAWEQAKIAKDQMQTQASKESQLAATKTTAENTARSEAGLPTKPVLPDQQPSQQPAATPAPSAMPTAKQPPSEADPYGILAQAKMFQKGEAETKAGLQQQYTADKIRAQAELDTLTEAQTKQKEQQDHYQSRLSALNNERASFIKDINDNHINPEHYMSSMGTGQRIQTAIGLILGGMGAGITHTANPALEFLNKQIDNDIQAQKMELGKKENLLSANLKQFGNERDATEMSRLQLADSVSNSMKMAAAKTTEPMAKARLLQAAGAWDVEHAPMAGQLAMRQTVLGGMQGGKDPSAMVQILVPPAHQKEAFTEIKRAQDTRRMGESILKDFEDAAKENTILKTGFGKLRTPASVYALHQSMQPTFADLEGTVRQAAMDNTFTNITPMPGDSEHTIQQKRKALQEYLSSKKSAPTAKGFGIDLDKFETTRPAEGAPEIKTMGGVKYQKTQGGWKRVP